MEPRHVGVEYGGMTTLLLIGAVPEAVVAITANVSTGAELRSPSLRLSVGRGQCL